MYEDIHTLRYYTYRQTDRHIYAQTDRHIYTIQTHIYKYRHIHICTCTDRLTHADGQIQTHR